MSATISVTLDDVKAARSAIGKFITMSPCTRSPRLSNLTGCALYLKMENMQRTGAYKDRGAMNKVLTLSDKQKQAGVIAASAGNHAQGLAFAAQTNKIRLAKLRGTEEYGAEVVLHGSGYDDAYKRAV